jgi:pentachlorophenol monooxygenase
VGVGRPLQLGDLLRGGAHTLLFYADRTTPEEDLVATEKIAAAAREQAHGTLDAYLLLGPDALPPTAAYPPVVTDAAGGFRRRYGLRGPATFLVRPDGYVGFRGPGYPADGLREHLARTFRASS